MYEIFGVNERERKTYIETPEEISHGFHADPSRERGLRSKGLREKSPRERVCLEFLRSRRGIFFSFTASSRTERDRRPFALPFQPFINSGGSKNFPLPIATSVICLSARRDGMRAREQMYICLCVSRGFWDLRVFRRKTDISYWWRTSAASLGGAGTDDIKETTRAELCFWCDAYEAKSGVGLGRIGATRGIMYVVNSESRFRVSRVPIGRADQGVLFDSRVTSATEARGCAGSRMKCDGGIVRVVDVIRAVDEETCRDCLNNRKLSVARYGR